MNNFWCRTELQELLWSLENSGASLRFINRAICGPMVRLLAAGFLRRHSVLICNAKPPSLIWYRTTGMAVR